MRLFSLALILTYATAAFADTITLRSGRVINGTYLGGTARTVRVDTGDRVETFDIGDVTRIEFRDSNAPSARVNDDAGRPTLRRSGNSGGGDDSRPTLRRADTADDDRPPAVRRADPTGGTSSTSGPIMQPDSNVQYDPVELPAGTALVVRMIQGVDSETARVGQTFTASIDEAVKGPNGEIVIPRGTDATVKLVDSKESGKLTGRAELTLDLSSIRIGDRSINIDSQSVTRESSSRGERTAKMAGGGAVAGAIIGAIAGGGKGAAIGAAAGGAAGTGAEAITKGQQVKVPSETRLTFTLENPVRI